MNNFNYEESYSRMMEYRRAEHEKNQNKIRVGLKINILLPLVFLFLSFVTNTSKFLFLVLWIASLFIISFYLIYIEYQDHKIMEYLEEFGFRDETPSEENVLIGGKAAVTEAIVTEKMDRATERIEEEKKRLEAQIEEEKKKMAAQMEKIRSLRGGKDDEEHN